jgi:hypothetical protein
MRIRLQLSRDSFLSLLNKCDRPSDQFSILISGCVSEVQHDDRIEVIAEILCNLESAEQLLAWANRNDAQAALEIRQSLQSFSPTRVSTSPAKHGSTSQPLKVAVNGLRTNPKII